MTSIAWTLTDSTNISGLFYSERTNTVCVRFQNGGLYTYMGVPEETFMNLLHAPSMGQYLHNVIKAFPYTRWGSEQELLDYLNLQ